MMERQDAPLQPTRPLGGTGLLVSPLCLGGNVFGWTADRTTSMEVLDAYVNAGGNVIDTADAYSQWVPGNHGGESESIIGDWMALRRNRDSVLIATKVAKLSSSPGLSAANIRSCADASLRRLRTDHIDLYYAHRDDPAVPLEETVGALDELVRAGKVRHVAASNFTADRLVASLEVSARDGLAGYEAVQNLYNLMDRSEYEGGLAEAVAARGLASLPFYGLARGFLTGKYLDAGVVDSPRADAARAYGDERGDRVLGALRDIADAHRTTMAATALAWLLARPSVTAPIASVRNVEQLSDLLDLGTLALSTDETALLDRVSS